MRPLRLLALASLLATAACPTGKVAETIRSDAPTANAALDGQTEVACGATPAYGEPLVIDLPSKGRLDLELAMKDGVPVVRYDCGKLELVRGCKLDGSFEYAGVSLKEDVVVLANRDEVRANLPISGATIAASLERGTSLQLALAMIGKQTTTVQEATTADLQGTCEGATHFVRASVVGAFALERGSAASVRAAAEIFGAGVSAGSGSDRAATMRDGKVEDCRTAAPDAAAPPGQCASSIRLELVPLVAARTKVADAASESAPAPWRDPCPEGYRLADGKCTQEVALAYVCAPADKADCRTQCDKGNAESCYHAAMPDFAADVKDRLPVAEAMKLLARACDGGSARGCTGLATFETLVAGASVDVAKVTSLFDRACAAGDPEGCISLAERFAHRSKEHAKWPADQARATTLWQRACDLGTEHACFTVASRYFKGLGSKQDIPRGVAVMQRGCDGGNAKRCNELGMLQLGLLGGGKEFAGIENAADGAALLDRTCTKMDSDDACRILAQLYATGTKVGKDPERAKAYFARACPSEKEAKACDQLAKLLPK
jgi:hypothetical protein